MDSQVEQYANIDDFFKKRVNEVMNMFDVNFKSNMILNIEAHKDNTKNIGGINYSIYNLSIPEKYEKYDHQGISKSEIPFIFCIYYN